MDKKKDYTLSKEQFNSIKRLQRNILSDSTPFAITEAYKSLRTNILFSRIGEGCQKIVFTSSFPNEGKSVSCINTGITLAQNGLRVLLIDGDMRHPTLKTAFEVKSEFGLSDFLAGMVNRRKDNEGILLETKYYNLFLLPSGRIPPNPAELLASQNMHKLLQTLSPEFDYILIDTPPFSLVTDAAVLAPLVNGYILITRANKITIEQLQSTVSRLEQLNAKIIGFILNDVEAKSGTYKHKRYGRYGHRKSYELDR